MGGGPEIPVYSHPSNSTQETAKPSPSEASDEREIRVFITGFGPFPNGSGGTFEKNSSHLISKLLPGALRIRSPRSGDAGDADTDAAEKGSNINVRIVNPTAAEGAFVPVEYKKIRTYLADFYGPSSADSASESQSEVLPGPTTPLAHSNKGKADIVIHLGMASGLDFVTVERVAYGEGFSSAWWWPIARWAGEYYMAKDNAGLTVKDAGPNPWAGIPIGLMSTFDIDGLASEANRMNGQQHLASYSPVRIGAHSEGGYYCCGFIHYESLAHCYTKRVDPNVLFCHVPGETDTDSLKRGRDAIVAVIKAAVLQLVAREAKGNATV